MDRVEDVGHGVTHVAVIGAGWAGLSAAVTLAERGTPVSVFEASRNLGGRARRVTVEGTELDNGQHVLIGACNGTLSLMRKVGADPDRLLLRLPLELRFADGFHLRAPRLPFPLNLLVGLLTTNGLNLRQGLAAMRFMSRLKATGFLVEPDVAVAAFLDSNGQDGPLRRYIWEPLCVSALNTPIERASARVFASVLRDALTGARANSDLLLPRADLGKIFPEPAADFVRGRGGVIELGAAIRRIRRDGEGFRLDDRVRHFSHLIIACAPQHAAALLDGFAELEATRHTIEALEFEPIYTCYLKYPDIVHLPAPMLGHSGEFVQWAFDRGQLSGARGLIAAVVSASGAHEELPQEVLTEKVHAELAGIVRNLPRPIWTRVIAERRATFSCRAAVRRPTIETPVERLLLAGDYTASDYPGTLEAAVRSGQCAAERALLAGRVMDY